MAFRGVFLCSVARSFFTEEDYRKLCISNPAFEADIRYVTVDREIVCVKSYYFHQTESEICL